MLGYFQKSRLLYVYQHFNHELIEYIKLTILKIIKIICIYIENKTIDILLRSKENINKLNNNNKMTIMNSKYYNIR